MVSEQLIKNGKLFFEPLNGRRQRFPIKTLNNVIREFNDSHLADAQYEMRLNQLIFDLKSDCFKCLGTDSVHVFGSAVNGFRSQKSDVDCFIELEVNGVDSKLLSLKSYMMKSARFRVTNYVNNARVPIITVIHEETLLECDICISVPAQRRSDVLKNTKLLKKYASMSPKIPATFRFYKHLLSHTTFSSVRTHGLSTYAHAIMFVYFLTHRSTPYVPHIDPTTYEPKYSFPLQFSEADLLIDYLHFISSELDTEKYSVNIRCLDKVLRPPNGRIGVFLIPDPYIARDLGAYMKEDNVYRMKVFCYRLLQLLLTKPLCCKNVKKWCDNSYKYTGDPPIHPDCSPIYKVERTSVEKEESKSAQTEFSVTDCYTVTIPLDSIPNLLGNQVDLTLLNQFKGDFLGEMKNLIETNLRCLQSVVVFENETLVCEAESVLAHLLLETVSVTTFKTSSPAAQVYLTTYYNAVASKVDVSNVTSILVYAPSFYVPASLWSILYSTLKCQVYFLIPYSGGHIPQQGKVDELAQLYGHSTFISKYCFTLPLVLIQNCGVGLQTPENIEVYQIIDSTAED